MAAKKKAAKAGAAAMAAKNSPYVQRVIEDEDLRQTIIEAYESARSAYGRLNNGKSPAKQIFDDKKLQKDLQAAASNLRDASQSLRQKPGKKKRGGGLGRLLLLVLVGGGAAVALSEGLRKKLLDALFGAEEEFEYTSATTPPAPAPSPAPSAN
jgi:hypothetical protein